MLTCHACQRHVRDSELRCPFCTATLRTAPAPGSLSSLALVAGLTLLACSDDGSEGTSTDSNANTDDVTNDSESTTSGETTVDTGETTMDTSGETTMDTGTETTSGETTTTDTLESASDYAGPPQCGEIYEDTLVVGDNPVDTTQGHDWTSSSCGELVGTGGNDVLYRFTAPNAASYSFALIDAAFEGWLVEGEGFDCYPVENLDCTVPQEALVMDLGAGEDVYLWLDGISSGVGTIVVTEG